MLRAEPGVGELLARVPAGHVRGLLGVMPSRAASYMEDMFVAAPLRGAGATGVANVAAAEGVGLTHVFAVDGHGASARRWARQPAEQPARELAARGAGQQRRRRRRRGGGGGSGEDESGALETASVDAFRATPSSSARRSTTSPTARPRCAYYKKRADGATDVLVTNLGDSRAALSATAPRGRSRSTTSPTGPTRRRACARRAAR